MKKKKLYVLQIHSQHNRFYMVDYNAIIGIYDNFDLAKKEEDIYKNNPKYNEDYYRFSIEEYEMNVTYIGA